MLSSWIMLFLDYLHAWTKHARAWCQRPLVSHTTRNAVKVRDTRPDREIVCTIHIQPLPHSGQEATTIVSNVFLISCMTTVLTRSYSNVLRFSDSPEPHENSFQRELTYLFSVRLGSHHTTTNPNTHRFLSTTTRSYTYGPCLAFFSVVLFLLYYQNSKNHGDNNNNKNRYCNSAALFLHSTLCHCSSFAARIVDWIGPRRRGGHCRTCRIHLVLLLLL